MILVDIYAPAVGNVYDFQLDEEERISTIIEEVGEMIGQKEQCRMVGETGRLMLCFPKYKLILPGNMTLAGAGVRNGDSLLLV